MKERREKQSVEDGVAENGIRMGNVLQAIVILILTWIGFTAVEGNRLLENHNVRIAAAEKTLDDHIREYKDYFIVPRKLD